MVEKTTAVGFVPILVDPGEHTGHNELALVLRKEEKGRPVTCLQSNGQTEDIKPHGRWSAGLLNSIGRLVNTSDVKTLVEPVLLQPGERPGVVKVWILLPQHVWSPSSRWKPSSSAVAVFNAVRPHDSRATGQELKSELLRLEELQGTAGRDHFTLESCFKEIPTCSRDPDPPPLLHQDESQEQAITIHELPKEVLRIIISHLGHQDPRSIARLAATCRCMRTLASDAAPALNVTLFPHQRAAVRWMIDRERGLPPHQAGQPAGPPPEEGPSPPEHPFITRFETPGGLYVYVNMATGSLGLEPPPQLPAVRGGFFCDEPGLGKTVTALALVLRTKGLTPQPPPGVQVFPTTDSQGRTALFYDRDAVAEVQEGSATAAQQIGTEWGLQAGSPGSHARASLRPRGRSLSGQLSLPEVGPSTSPAQPPDPMLWQQLLPAPMPSNGHGHLGSQGDTWGHSNGGSVISLQQSGVNGASAQGAGVDGSQPLLSGAPNGIGHDGEPHEPPPLVRVECAACHKVRFVPPDSLNQGPAALLGPAPGWVCDMHPDPARRSCDLPQEQAPGADGLMEADPGYSFVPDAPPSSRNIEHFRKVLSSSKEQLDSSLGAIKLLLQLRLKTGAQLHPFQGGGMNVPSEARQVSVDATSWYGHLLKRLRLVPLSEVWDQVDMFYKQVQEVSTPAGSQSDLLCTHLNGGTILNGLNGHQQHATPSKRGRGGSTSAKPSRKRGRSPPDVYEEDVLGPSSSSSDEGDDSDWVPSSDEEGEGPSNGRKAKGRGRGASRGRGGRTTKRGTGRGRGRGRTAQPADTLQGSAAVDMEVDGHGLAGAAQGLAVQQPRARSLIKRPSVRTPAARQHVWVTHPALGYQYLDLDALGLALAQCAEARLLPKYHVPPEFDSRLKKMRRAAAPDVQQPTEPLVQSQGGDGEDGGRDEGGPSSQGPGWGPPSTGGGSSRPARERRAPARLQGAITPGRLGSGVGGEDRRVYLSQATLVVVPDTMIRHWEHQIMAHVKPGQLRVVVVVTGADTQGPLSAKQLAWDYDLVLTDFPTLSNIWQPSTMAGKLHKGAASGAGAGSAIQRARLLLQVHFLRVILDEGHDLGSLQATNKLQTARDLLAERRWVMTGTPTPSAKDSSSGVAHLQPLLDFLGHVPYGTNGRRMWEAAVLHPLESRRPEGRARLMSLLRTHMIRASKEDLKNLPPLNRTVTLLDFAPEHAATYNQLVEVVRRNLLIADFNDEDHKESLMNVKQGKWARQMLENLRLSCCVAGSMNYVVSEPDLVETLELLCERHGYPPLKEAWGTYLAKSHAHPDNGTVQTVIVAPGEPVAGQQQGATQGGTSGGSQSEAQGPQEPQPGTQVVKDAGHQPEGTGGEPGPSSSQPSRRQAAPGRRPSGARATVTQREPPEWEPPAGTSLPPGHPFSDIEEGLRRGAACKRCTEFTRQPIVTPCAHLLCLDCAGESPLCCPVPGCSTPYKMQPVEDPQRLEDNPDPKWPVPLELIEWQPVYHQLGAEGVSGGEWSEKWTETRSTRCIYLIRRLWEVGAARKGSGQVDTRQPHIKAEGGVNEEGKFLWYYTPPRPFSDLVPASASVVAHVEASAAAACAGLEPPTGGPATTTTRGILKCSSRAPHPQAPAERPLTKAIIFSQFILHIQLIASELMKHYIPYVILSGTFKRSDRDAAVHRFTLDPDIGILIMDEKGAVGLDLSFVSHVFLMEPIANRSTEQQVVSRAHRMGAKAPVHVELFAMRGTAEQAMLDLGALITRGAAAAAAGGGAEGAAGSEEPAGGGGGGGEVMRTEEEAVAAAARQARALATSDSSLPPPAAVSSSHSSVVAGTGSLVSVSRKGLAASAGQQQQAEGAVTYADTSGALPGAPVPRLTLESSRGVRNLFFLRLHKVATANLPEYHDLLSETQAHSHWYSGPAHQVQQHRALQPPQHSGPQEQDIWQLPAAADAGPSSQAGGAMNGLQLQTWPQAAAPTDTAGAHADGHSQAAQEQQQELPTVGASDPAVTRALDAAGGNVGQTATQPAVLKPRKSVRFAGD